jgi:aminopeptidase N
MTSARLRVLAGLTALLAAAALAAPQGAQARAGRGDDRSFRPGAAGVGDPYYPIYGNGGYDVAHYDLAVSYDPATDVLAGVARIRATATQDLSRFNLDLQGLSVRSVRVDGRRASWTRELDHELVITPARGLREGRRFDVAVRYDGVPRTQVIPGLDLEAGFIHTDDGAVVAGQPEVAANWFPVNDHPVDKASYTFLVTVPRGLEVIANGRLLAHRDHGASSTWLWDAREPMASYLATASVGQYDLTTSRNADGVQFYDAFDPDLSTQSTDPQDPAAPTFGAVARESFGHEQTILDFLSDTFGRYPFSTAGGSVDDYDNLFFALENQTRTVYSKFFFFDSVGGDFVIVHENAHQWYGDDVAVAQWRDIWLNEGFATYAEWLWSEHEGLGTAQENFDFFFDFFPADSPFWNVSVADPGVDRLFDNQSYFRGAMVLHQLRLAVGDDTFFQILRGWHAEHAGGNGSTPQFIEFAERVSGQQLDALFQTWLFEPHKPVLPVSAAQSQRSSVGAAAPAAAASELARRGRV